MGKLLQSLLASGGGTSGGTRLIDVLKSNPNAVQDEYDQIAKINRKNEQIRKAQEEADRYAAEFERASSFTGKAWNTIKGIVPFVGDTYSRIGSQMANKPLQTIASAGTGVYEGAVKPVAQLLTPKKYEGIYDIGYTPKTPEEEAIKQGFSFGGAIAPYSAITKGINIASNAPRIASALSGSTKATSALNFLKGSPIAQEFAGGVTGGQLLSEAQNIGERGNQFILDVALEGLAAAITRGKIRSPRIVSPKEVTQTVDNIVGIADTPVTPQEMAALEDTVNQALSKGATQEEVVTEFGKAQVAARIEQPKPKLIDEVARIESTGKKLSNEENLAINEGLKVGKPAEQSLSELNAPKLTERTQGTPKSEKVPEVSKAPEKPVETKTEISFGIAKKMENKTDEQIIESYKKDVKGYRETGIGFEGDSQPSNASLLRLGEFSELPAVKTQTKKDLSESIQKGEITPNEDGSITVYRVGEVPKTDRLTSVTYSKDYADEFSKGTKSIEEFRINPEDVKVFIGRDESEILVNSKVLKENKQVPTHKYSSKIKQIREKIEKKEQDLKDIELQAKEIGKEQYKIQNEIDFTQDSKYESFKRLLNRFPKKRDTLLNGDVDSIKSLLGDKIKSSEIDSIFHDVNLSENEMYDKFVEMFHSEKNDKRLKSAIENSLNDARNSNEYIDIKNEIDLLKSQEIDEINKDIASTFIEEPTKGNKVSGVEKKTNKNNSSITAQKMNERFSDDKKLSTEYDVIEINKKLEEASAKLNKNPDKTIGEAFSDEGSRVDRVSTLVELFDKSVKDGDEFMQKSAFNKLKQLAPETAQTMNMFKALTEANPHFSYMSKVVDEKLKNLVLSSTNIRKAVKGMKKNEAMKKVVKEKKKLIQKEIDGIKPKFSVVKAQSLLDSILCK